ncbi:MAG: hypothetical protein ACYC91_20705, partial [Solirubrobacteraceae bacterium]
MTTEVVAKEVGLRKDQAGRYNRLADLMARAIRRTYEIAGIRDGKHASSTTVVELTTPVMRTVARIQMP